MKSILIVDDDERLLSLIAELVKLHNYEVTEAKSAAQARALLMSHDFDAMIVDWMMPNESGIEFIKSVRNSTSHIKNIPAIMLTAMDNIDNKIIGFDSGFDDYITKPFEERELIARLRALINRTQKDQKNKVIQFGDCEFNLETDVLLVNSKEVYLSTTELTLLKTLCQKPNHPFSRMELAKKLTFRVSDRTIDVQITRLRKKIGDNPKNPTIIKTIRYIGYSLVMQPMNFV